MRHLHLPDLVPNGFIVKADFTELPEAQRWSAFEPSFASGQINHYWTKSFEEFSIKKARGEGVRDHDRDFESFFSWNGEETPENHTPAPEPLVVAVEQEIARLMALPGVAEGHAEIVRRLPALLARFDQYGGLRSIYEAACRAAGRC